MQLEDGRFLMAAERYDALLKVFAIWHNFSFEPNKMSITENLCWLCLHSTMIRTFSSYMYVRTLDNQGCVQLASVNVAVHLAWCDYVKILW